jgi:flavodoxin
MNKSTEEFSQKLERIGIRIYNILKDEGIILDAEDMDELEDRVLNWVVKHDKVK